MRNKITQSIKLSAIGLTFLFGMGTAQMVHADPFPAADPDYFAFTDLGGIGSGITSSILGLQDNDPNAAWFKFTLDIDAQFTLDTTGTDEIGDLEDTVLGLYDNDGVLLGQNDDCLLPSLLSCLSSSGVAGTMFYVGVAEYEADDVFQNNWLLDSWTGGGDNVQLNIDVSPIAVSPIPVPAAVWLFGTALLGFVGMSRRTSIKS